MSPLRGKLPIARSHGCDGPAMPVSKRTGHAANDADQYPEVAGGMPDDSRPCIFAMLCDEGERATGRDHPHQVPQSRLQKEMEHGPEDAMVDPRRPAARPLLAREQITPPPELLSGNIAQKGERTDNIMQSTICLWWECP